MFVRKLVRTRILRVPRYILGILHGCATGWRDRAARVVPSC